MGRLTISAALLIAATVVASAPAGAAENWGPNKNGTQCFTSAKGEGKDLQFGHWGACPQPASVAVGNTAGNTAASSRRRSRSASR